VVRLTEIEGKVNLRDIEKVHRRKVGPADENLEIPNLHQRTTARLQFREVKAITVRHKRERVAIGLRGIGFE
jgi:hypothetical protein